MISLFGVGATLPVAFILPAASGTVAVLAFAVFFIGLPIGCGYAGLQFILPNRIRGLASAVVILIVNLMGLGIGSFLPGLFTDQLFGDELKVGYSIALTVTLSSITGILALLSTMRPYRQHYAEMHAPTPAPT